MRDFKQPVSWFFFLLAIWLIPLSSPAENVAGYIYELSGNISSVSVDRQGTSLPAAIFMELNEGDRLVIKEPGTRVTINLADEKNNVIGMEQSPYVIARQGASPSVSDNLIAWAGDWISGLYQDAEEARTIAAVARGSGPAVSAPLLMAEPLVVTTAHDSLCLAWQGGLAPYRVSLTAKGSDEPVATQEERETTQTCITVALAYERSYTLSIQSANGRKFRSKLRVVPVAERPAMPPEIQDADVDDAMKATLYTAWLAAQSSPRWLFEAYQEIHGVADEYEPAALVKASLMQGNAGRL